MIRGMRKHADVMHVIEHDLYFCHVCKSSAATVNLLFQRLCWGETFDHYLARNNKMWNRTTERVN